MVHPVSGDGWVYLRHNETGGHTSVPDAPGVLENWQARGWVKADEPEAGPFVPPKGDLPAAAEWVELVHPGLKARHEFPNNPEAIAGAVEAGWELPTPPKPEPEPEPPKKPSKKAAPSATEKEE
jgi:hypothetical protein